MLNNQVLQSFKWSALSEVASKVLPPLFYIISARLLTPDDFGIVAISSMIVAFASILWEAGLSKAIIQNQDNNKLLQMSNIVLYSNIVLSVVVYIILFVFSYQIASFFNDIRVSDVLKVSGLSIIIGPFMSVQTALLQKEFGFKKLFYSRIVGALIPGIVSVIMAYLGFGYWSLVYGSIVSFILQAIILWLVSDWRPSLEYNLQTAKEMFNFSKWVLFSALLSWFFAWGDTFILGFFFSSHELGLYRTGNYFISAIFGLITTPLIPVMYSYFSKIQDNKDRVRDTLLMSSKTVSFFILPAGTFLFIMQTQISDIIFGDKWTGIASVIGLLSLQQAISWIIGLNTTAFSAIGKPDIESKINFIAIWYYLATYLIFAQISFKAFLIARLILTMCTIFLHIFFSKKHLSIGYYLTFSNIKYILFTLLVIFSITFYLIDTTNIIFTFLSIFISIYIYLFIIYKFDKPFINDLFKFLKNQNK